MALETSHGKARIDDRERRSGLRSAAAETGGRAAHRAGQLIRAGSAVGQALANEHPEAVEARRRLDCGGTGCGGSAPVACVGCAHGNSVVSIADQPPARCAERKQYSPYAPSHASTVAPPDGEAV
jgi:hypothetical protein